MAEKWVAVHRHGDDLAVSGHSWPTKEAVIEARKGNVTFLGAICLNWLTNEATDA